MLKQHQVIISIDILVAPCTNSAGGLFLGPLYYIGRFIAMHYNKCAFLAFLFCKIAGNETTIQF